MHRTRRHAWRWFLVGGAVMLAAYAGWTDAPLDTMYNSVSASCALAIVAGLLLHRPTHRGGWILLALGAASFTAGDLVFSAYAGDPPFPSWADAFYVAGYPCLAAGLVWFARHRGADRETALDSVVVATGLGAMVWLTVVRPLAEQGGAEWLQKAVALAYPVGSVLLLTAAVSLLLTGGLKTAPIRLVAAGAIAQLAGDGAYAHQAVAGTYVDGGWVDIAWLVAYLFIGAAALHPSMESVTRRTQRHTTSLTRNRFLLLMAAACAAPMAYVVFEVSPHQLAGGSAAIVVALVGIRLGGPVHQLARSASHDALTGLPNRAVLCDRLDAALASASPSEGVGLLFCDLDDFKLVNDGLGHSEGDRLLVELAARLRSVVREGDLVARFAGDEFVVLAPGITDQRELDALARRVSEDVRRPVMLAGDTLLRPSMSIGAALAHDRDASVEELLGDADAAMYRAKRRGPARIAHADSVTRGAAIDRLATTNELRRAIDGGELFCLYQPELDLSTGTLFGVEALVRWNHPVRGVLAPDDFVPLAEAHGLVDDLFAAVVRMALQQQAAWHADLGWHPAVSVNASARQDFDGLVETLTAVLEEFQPPAGTVWLELTETVLHEDDLARFVDRLHALGVLVAIDDFGTGWASLARLVSCSWDLLKIDQSFVAGVGASSQSDHVVSATLAMARSLGIRTAAEGVETAAQARTLTDLGCDIAQGYLYAPPVAGADVVALVDGEGRWVGRGVEVASRG